MKLSQAVAKSRTVTVPFDGAELSVTYRPASYTTRELQELQEDKDLRRVAQTIQRTVVEWDLEDEAGKPFPLKGDDALERLVDEVPISVFTEILRAVQEDQAPGKREDLRRWLRSNGVFGSCPDWYEFLRAAKYLGVPPWDLLDQPRWWVEVALAAQAAEAAAQAADDKPGRKGRRGADGR